MAKSVNTTKRRRNSVKTRKNSSISSTSSGTSIYKTFEKEITIKFFEMLLMIKLYHWKTHSYATHKATDDLYTKINEHMDKFIEVLLGKTNTRINLMNQKTIGLCDLNNTSELIHKVKDFKSYLVNLNNNKAMKTMSNSDLLNIRDEILADMNQFLYLLTFK